MIGRCVANRPDMNIIFNNSFNDSSISAYSTTNNGTTATVGINGETNGARNFSTEAVAYSITVNQQAGKDITTAFNTAGGGTICFWGKWGTNSGTNVSMVTNVWGFATNTWAWQLYIYKNSSKSSASVNFRNGTNTTGFGSSGTTITEDLNQWQFVSLNVNGDGGTNTYWDLNVGSQEVYNSSSANTIQVPASTEYIFGRRTDSPANQNMNGDLSNYRHYEKKLSKGRLAIIKNEKGRIRA